jgi:replicative DNA helicase Mcm
LSSDEDFDVEVVDKSKEWADFLSKKYKQEIRTIGREFPYKRSLTINYETLQKFGKTGVKLADELLSYPNKVFAEVRDALRTHNLLARKDAHELIPRINIRFVNLPRKTLVRDIRSEQMNTFVSVDGIIRKTTEVRPRIVEAVFRCPSGHMTLREQGYGRFVEPESCGMADCTQKRLELVILKSKFVDAQKIRIQETPEGLRGGEQPQILDIDATDDLTGLAAPGDRVVVNGILKSIQRMTGGTKSTTFDIYLDCNSIEFGEKEFEEVNITEEDEAAILELSKDPNLYRKIAHSIAPTIYGNDDVKEAVSLQLFGGIAKEMPDGSTLRGDIHVLLVGDPGIAKSQLLRYVVKLSPRGIYTSGKSATSAGLTAAAVKDEFGDGKWTLEAGALVLADMGIAAVDEMDKMQKDDRSSLHEAMEQQCYDEDTEVLTKEGWKRFCDVNPTDLIATLSKEGCLEYQPSGLYVATPYSGEMYRFKSRQVDLLVTPNHNMYVDVNKRANTWNGYELVRADSLNPNKRMRFKKDAVWVGERVDTHVIPPVVLFSNHMRYETITEPIEVDMDLWLEFLGYFLSEGCVGKHYKTGVPYRVFISQKKPESTKIMNACMSQMPFTYKYVDGNFVINSKQLASHLECFGKSPDMHIPDYVKELPPEQIRILVDALVLGDGSIRKDTGHISYITSSKQLADGLSELLLKLGISGNTFLEKESGSLTSTPRGGTAIVSNDIYEVSFIRENQPNINTNGNYHVSKEKYSGMVYCVEVPNHVIYVRRNGIPVWCGNTISIAKAGITATLKTRCALLGAANPKLGRFDEYVGISEQINMPPSLLSRFDLIFIMTDKSDKQRDEAIAQHILKAHSVGELIMQHKKTPIAGVDEAYIQKELAPVTPEIDPVMFRKYIAYAKRNAFPIITQEAKDTLVDYYMKLRSLASPDKPVPVTARQLEALVRLAEASARTRLSASIERDDAVRVIKIVDNCLRKVAYDPQTGSFDIDKIVTGVSKQSRDLIRSIKETIRQSGDDTGTARTDQIIDILSQKGFARDAIEKQIETLLRGGEALSPRNGLIKLI